MVRPQQAVGFYLIELVIAMMIVSTMMGASALFLQQLLGSVTVWTRFQTHLNEAHLSFQLIIQGRTDLLGSERIETQAYSPPLTIYRVRITDSQSLELIWE
ncbi:hypothetical protein DID77_02820 [Candidatus Marinamargulisbacteria bacterium SCGC AG-439-L15]|nr:hypothetical protein DID77_02820 [Candidatus Marinamargulisbacteria bacterium SCGC AG-439-L15]